ncbi:MAG: hypothetical protein ACK4K7_13900 [Allosphingosinicella sp.]|uniref:hypothetical protein n=1 Tax=Allosphingosinicella sp. TaxID=2823234 RepID=UPI0039257347
MKLTIAAARPAGILFAALASVAALSSPADARKSDAEIRQEIIRESIRNYSGSCPCPYSTARNGSRCGGRSAYSRPGGASPKCFASDVSQAEVNARRGR